MFHVKHLFVFTITRALNWHNRVNAMSPHSRKRGVLTPRTLAADAVRPLRLLCGTIFAERSRPVRAAAATTTHTAEQRAGECSQPGRPNRASQWFCRIAYTVVFVLNVQCALSFCIVPDQFMGAYELSGTAGRAAVQGIGIAFLMWNATYPPVIASPQRFRSLAVVVLVQQAIGLVGESLLRASLPVQNGVLAESITRFIWFDGAGLILMAAALATLAVSSARGARRQRQ